MRQSDMLRCVRPSPVFSVHRMRLRRGYQRLQQDVGSWAGPRQSGLTLQEAALRQLVCRRWLAVLLVVGAGRGA
jgi:hypothetical protein